MDEIPYKLGFYYIFDRSYNNFKMLYKIYQIEAYWKRIFNTNPSNGSVDCLRMYFQTQVYFWQDSILNNIIRSHLDWLNIGMKNKNENLHS